MRVSGKDAPPVGDSGARDTPNGALVRDLIVVTSVTGGRVPGYFSNRGASMVTILE